MSSNDIDMIEKMQVLDPVARILQEVGVRLDPDTRASLSLMHRCVALGQVERLGEYRGDVDAQDYFGYTPLHYAVLLTNLDAVRDLLELGADPNMQDHTKNKYSSLHLACKYGQIAMVKAFLQYPQIGSGLDLPSGKHGTALHLACKSQSLPIVEVLTKTGADVNAKDAKGRTPLHIISLEMISNGKSEDVGQFIGYLAQGNALQVDTFDQRMCTPLHFAALTGNKIVLDHLLARGADPNAMDKAGRTPLHYAVNGIAVGVDSGMGSCLKSLLDAKASVDLKDRQGLTAYQTLEILFRNRGWRKGEKTALNVGLVQLQKAQDNILATQRAEAAAKSLLLEETTTSKSKKKSKS